ncbi:MAG: hypothetical protein KF764_21345 [Labilithrix sp.]|nr:hypothetical protein [Labilithrix sp.]MBX3223077.1 hypothetical protein [Labilithrix sp.]
MVPRRRPALLGPFVHRRTTMLDLVYLGLLLVLLGATLGLVRLCERV